MTSLQTPGEQMLHHIRETYSFLLARYEGKVVKESWDEYGCEWVVRVNGSIFRFVWDYRDWSPDFFGIELLLGCPDSQSSLNGWWNWMTILEFIAYLEGGPPPEIEDSRKPEAFERIVQFIRNPDYSRWCGEFDSWRKTRQMIGGENAGRGRRAAGPG